MPSETMEDEYVFHSDSDQYSIERHQENRRLNRYVKSEDHTPVSSPTHWGYQNKEKRHTQSVGDNTMYHHHIQEQKHQHHKLRYNSHSFTGYQSVHQTTNVDVVLHRKSSERMKHTSKSGGMSGPKISHQRKTFMLGDEELDISNFTRKHDEKENISSLVDKSVKKREYVCDDHIKHRFDVSDNKKVLRTVSYPKSGRHNYEVVCKSKDIDEMNTKPSSKDAGTGCSFPLTFEVNKETPKTICSEKDVPASTFTSFSSSRRRKSYSILEVAEPLLRDISKCEYIVSIEDHEDDPDVQDLKELTQTLGSDIKQRRNDDKRETKQQTSVMGASQKKPSSSNYKKQSTQSVDGTNREKRTKFLTRQQTFRMDSIEMLESLLCATTGRNNNLMLSSKHNKILLKRNSAPDNTPCVGLGLTKRNSQPITNKLQDYRLVVLGSGAVGKSSLVMQFLTGFFPSQYKPTVEDSYHHLVQLPGGVFHTIEILDTAGLHQFPAMRRLSIMSGDAFIVVFSVDNRESFEEALQLIQLIFETKGINPDKERVPIILVGNKCDLEEARQVPHEEAFSTALQKNLCAYIQTSAKHNENVQQLFSELLVQTFAEEEKHHGSGTTSSNGQKCSRTGSSFKSVRKQLSVKMHSISKRHNSDSTEYRTSIADNHMMPRKMSTGCNITDPACCIL